MRAAKEAEEPREQIEEDSPDVSEGRNPARESRPETAAEALHFVVVADTLCVCPSPVFWSCIPNDAALRRPTGSWMTKISFNDPKSVDLMNWNSS
eukprot:g45286.t1